MGQRFYTTSQFAQRASVSIRTLRYYDAVGLLSPTCYTEAGYRLYTNADFLRLQQILALKFLGFSLDEIKRYLQVGPTLLQEALTLQRAMMQEKRTQLDSIIQAIDETELLLQSNQQGWNSIVRVIQVIQMAQTNDWQKKYFTDEQLKQMEELSQKSYTEEDREKLAEWGKNWSEEDQKVVTQRWNTLFAELKRLVATGQDPASPEAQSLAQQWAELIAEFTHGDPGVAKGLKKWYDGYGELPQEQRPASIPYNEEEAAFIQKALELRQQNT